MLYLCIKYLTTMEETFFASAEREDQLKVEERNASLSNSEQVSYILNAIPEIAVILNKERQIIFSNNSLLNFLGFTDKKGVLGYRPGEILDCINSELHKSGCGTSENCRYCGAINAIIESQEKMITVTKECRITAKKDGKHEFMDLRVTSTPFEFEGNTYSILAVNDISDFKRRHILEKIFFHDIINLAGGLQGFIGLLKETEDSEELSQYINIAEKISKEMVDEIISQRTLTSAEHNDLEVNFNNINSLNTIKETVQYLSQHALARNKHINISPDAVSYKLNTDETLLKRVLINMIKNALEAIPKNSEIILNVYKEENNIVFTVHNDGFIETGVQMQIFQRSFSTKGINRGIGTYSIKLLTERYLQGNVGFVSTENEGTTFYVKLPIE